MKRFKNKWWLWLICLWVTPALALAQESCPDIVQAALTATDTACAGTSRNQACYGNISLEAVAREGVANFSFSQPGDIVDVAGVQTLTLQPLEEDTSIWGVALMQLQANVPDSLPGSNVTFLLFGDVQIENAVETNTDPITIEVTSTGDINVRSGPSTNDNVVTSLGNGETVTANGRIEDGSWLRIVLPGDDGGAGWVSADLVTTEDDISLLDIVDPLALVAPPLNPMQAFYFRSGVGDAPCEEAPDSGILIQTPEGAGQINLTVNDVEIQLGSTAYLQAQNNGEMTVNVVEHQATVSSDGTARFVPAGSRVRVPLVGLQADGPPSEPEPYDDAALAALPVRHMPRSITVAPALTEGEISELALSLPVSGSWLYTSGDVTLGGDCAGFMDASMFPSTSQVVTLDGVFFFDPTGNLQTMQIPELGTLEFSNPEPGVFIAETNFEGVTLRYEIHVLSPTEIEGLTHIDMAQEGFTCIMDIPFTMVAQGE